VGPTPSMKPVEAKEDVDLIAIREGSVDIVRTADPHLRGDGRSRTVRHSVKVLKDAIV